MENKGSNMEKFNNQVGFLSSLRFYILLTSCSRHRESVLSVLLLQFFFANLSLRLIYSVLP